MLYFEISHLSKIFAAVCEICAGKSFSCVDQPSIAHESSFKRNHNIKSLLEIKNNLKKEKLEKLSQFFFFSLWKKIYFPIFF